MSKKISLAHALLGLGLAGAVVSWAVRSPDADATVTGDTGGVDTCNSANGFDCNGYGGYGGVTPPARPATVFMTFCNEVYTQHANLTWPQAQFPMCDNFDSEMRSFGESQYGRYLTQGQSAYQALAAATDGNSVNGTDNADWLYLGGHGLDGRVVIANRQSGTDTDTNFYFSSTRWGNNNRQLKVAQLNLCDTMRGSISTAWANFGVTFTSGLKLALGSVGTMYSFQITPWAPWMSFNNNDAKVVDDTHYGRTFDAAWRDRHDNWPANEHPATMASGQTASDCWYRMDNMKVSNYQTIFPRLADSQVAYGCRRSE